MPCSWLCSVSAGSCCQAVASVAGTWGSPLTIRVCIQSSTYMTNNSHRHSCHLSSAVCLLIPRVSHPHPSHWVGLTVVLRTAHLLAFSCSSLLPPLLLWWFRNHSPGGHSVCNTCRSIFRNFSRTLPWQYKNFKIVQICKL